MRVLQSWLPKTEPRATICEVPVLSLSPSSIWDSNAQRQSDLVRYQNVKQERATNRLVMSGFSRDFVCAIEGVDANIVSRKSTLSILVT